MWTCLESVNKFLAQLPLREMDDRSSYQRSISQKPPLILTLKHLTQVEKTFQLALLSFSLSVFLFLRSSSSIKYIKYQINEKIKARIATVFISCPKSVTQSYGCRLKCFSFLPLLFLSLSSSLCLPLLTVSFFLYSYLSFTIPIYLFIFLSVSLYLVILSLSSPCLRLFYNTLYFLFLSHSCSLFLNLFKHAWNSSSICSGSFISN